MKGMTRRAITLTWTWRALAMVACLFSAIGAARAGEWTDRDFARFRLLPSHTAVGAEGGSLIGLEVALEPGWQFYGANPGEFGIAPEFDWAKSRNLRDAAIHWPPPTRTVYSQTPLVITWGYKRALLLPMVLAPRRADAAMDIRLALDYAVCEAECVIDTVTLRLALPRGPGHATDHDTRLRQALAAAEKVAR